jgi:acylpyruvate hydrolase
MRLATVRHNGRTAAARVEGEQATLLNFPDVGALLGSTGSWRRAAEEDGETLPVDSLQYAPLVPTPSKIICIGLNYRAHIEEVGETPPSHPTLFAKFSAALVGASDPICLPQVSEMVDWEVELVTVIGVSIRHGNITSSGSAIAGFTVGNDISVRDFQRRTSQWLQGKTFESSTPVGPHLVTADETGQWPDLEIRCEVDGDVRQRSRTSDLLFGPAELVSYISQILTLLPGDLIFTGTPSGVGAGRQPPVFLRPGQTVTSAVEGIGAMVNPCVKEAAA